MLSSVADVSLQRLQPICWGQSVERYHFKPATHLLGSKCGKVSLQACNPSAGVKVWKGITFRGPVVLVVAAIVVAVVVVVAVVSKSWRQQFATKSSWRQQSATTILAATICHQKSTTCHQRGGGNNLPLKSWRQQSATKKLAAIICHQKACGSNRPAGNNKYDHHVLSSVAYVLCTPPSLHSIAHSLQASRHCSTSTEIQRRAF